MKIKKVIILISFLTISISAIAQIDLAKDQAETVVCEKGTTLDISSRSLGRATLTCVSACAVKLVTQPPANPFGSNSYCYYIYLPNGKSETNCGSGVYTNRNSVIQEALSEAQFRQSQGFCDKIIQLNF